MNQKKEEIQAIINKLGEGLKETPMGFEALGELIGRLGEPDWLQNIVPVDMGYGSPENRREPEIRISFSEAGQIMSALRAYLALKESYSLLQWRFDWIAGRYKEAKKACAAGMISKMPQILGITQGKRSKKYDSEKIFWDYYWLIKTGFTMAEANQGRVKTPLEKEEAIQFLRKREDAPNDKAIFKRLCEEHSRIVKAGDKEEKEAVSRVLPSSGIFDDQGWIIPKK